MADGQMEVEVGKDGVGRQESAEKSASQLDAAVFGLELRLAARTGDESRLAKLIDAHGDLDSRNATGETAAIFAAQNGWARCLSMLIGAGCAIDAKRKDGSTAAILAAVSGHEDCLRLLLDAECDMDAKDKNGLSAEKWARLAGKHGCARMLDAESERRALRSCVPAVGKSSGGLRM